MGRGVTAALRTLNPCIQVRILAPQSEAKFANILTVKEDDPPLTSPQQPSRFSIWAFQMDSLESLPVCRAQPPVLRNVLDQGSGSPSRGEGGIGRHFIQGCMLFSASSALVRAR